MARGTLHSPKPEGQRRRRNAPTHDSKPLVQDGEIRGPELEELTLRDDWSPYVRQWYETWRRSPQAAYFLDTDWQRLGLLARAVAQVERKMSATLMGEIRMNEERLGATVTDRMRARMVIEEAEQDKAPVLEIVDAKARLAERLKGNG